MFHEPGSNARADVGKNAGAGNNSGSLPESLGITRFFRRTYVVGGVPYGSMADAIAQGRHLQFQAIAL